MKKHLNCVLLIDDDEDDNFYHKIILRETGIAKNIEVAETAYHALEYLQNTQFIPELIFLDINMPRMNGWEFLEHYQKISAGQQTKAVIIMLTTSLNPSDEKRAKTIPEINGFESKPLTHEIIKRLVEKYFEHL